MPDPLTFTLNVPAVMIMGIWLAMKLCRVPLCALVSTLLRQVMVTALTLDILVFFVVCNLVMVSPSDLVSVLALPCAV